MTAVEPADLLRQKDVLARLRVVRSTLLRYEAAGLIEPVRLPSGHRRYRPVDVDRMAELGSAPRHVPYPHPGAFVACHACSKTAGQPVRWESCGAR